MAIISPSRIPTTTTVETMSTSVIPSDSDPYAVTPVASKYVPTGTLQTTSVTVGTMLTSGKLTNVHCYIVH